MFHLLILRRYHVASSYINHSSLSSSKGLGNNSNIGLRKNDYKWTCNGISQSQTVLKPDLPKNFPESPLNQPLQCSFTYILIYLFKLHFTFQSHFSSYPHHHSLASSQLTSQSHLLWGVSKFWQTKLGQDQTPPRCIKTEFSISPQGIGSNTVAHSPGIDPGPASRGFTDSPNFTIVSHIWRAQLALMEAPQLLIQIEFMVFYELGSTVSRFLHHGLDISCTYIPSSFSLIGLTEFGLVLGCVSLHLVPSVNG